MSELLGRTEFQVVVLAVGAITFVLSVVVVTLAKFYRRCGADEALVRTGAGGNKVVIGGGVVVYPIVHQLLRVSLRSNKLSVEREGKNALVTKDKIRANVTTELYVKVEPLAEDVLAAARSFGERSLDAHAIATLIEGKLTDALRSVAANQTFMDLHSQRKQFAEHIQTALSEELKKNGLTLENVSITSLSMVPVDELDARDVFDAEGLRAITDSVQSNAEKTNQIQREKDLAIRTTNVEARKRALALEQDQAHAEADQQRSVAEYQAAQRAETAKVVFQQEQNMAVAQQARVRAEREAQIATARALEAAEIEKAKQLQTQTIEKEKSLQAAEIDRERALEAATIEKQKVIEAAEIAKQQAIEVARIEKEIAVTHSEEQAARAAAQKAAAEADEESARQAIATAAETARANREKAIAIIEAEKQAEQARIAAERDARKRRVEAEAAAETARVEAEGQADAQKTMAQATVERGAAEAEARRRILDAENAVAPKLLLREVALRALEVLPDVTRELMAPAHAIKEIKVLHLQGAGGAPAEGGQAFGLASPVLKAVLEAGAAYPLLREMLQFTGGADGLLAEKGRALLAELPAELRETLAREPSLATIMNGAAPPAGRS